MLINWCCRFLGRRHHYLSQSPWQVQTDVLLTHLLDSQNLLRVPRPWIVRTRRVLITVLWPVPLGIFPAFSCYAWWLKKAAAFSTQHAPGTFLAATFMTSVDTTQRDLIKTIISGTHCVILEATSHQFWEFCDVHSIESLLPSCGNQATI